MIQEFKQQTSETILSFLNRISRSTRVYTKCCTGVFPSLQLKDAYFYVAKNEIVILCKDVVSFQTLEIANEVEQLCEGKSPYYISMISNAHRASTVWQLQEAARLIQITLFSVRHPFHKICCVVLTNANLSNLHMVEDNDWLLLPYDVKFFASIDELPNYNVHIGRSGSAEGEALVNSILSNINDCSPAQQPKQLFCQLAEEVKARYQESKKGITLVDDDELDDDEICDSDEEQIEAEVDESLPIVKKENTIKVEVLEPISNPHGELEKLVGCDNIKSQVADLFEMADYNRWMQLCYPSWKRHDLSLHAIFFGHPGTGKTTVCKIYGALLKEAGVLKSGHVVVCNRGTFLGNNWGDEEKAVRHVLEKAKDGVLMIDEAYLLNSSHPNDPGKLVIPMLMDVLSNENQRNLAIVLCGYKEPMQRLLDLNPGLASRFPNRFEFRDFTIDELAEITRRRIREHNYHFTRTAWMKYRQLLTDAYALRDPQNWGNARFVAILLEHIYLLHAKRCMRQQFPRTNRFFSITPADIQPIEVSTEKKHIGF